ncbi:DUF2292 domain-containing protein [Pectinatus sottacetonis]|uniref:DUF2292 domain-containing protein n=1 Tax=Pectinatus sottacetonis TaxID=1002795 RepID=UPI0018C6FE7F|nr:DUF2292 domain-containing protein [Pectinatus sottacetonis]
MIKTLELDAKKINIITNLLKEIFHGEITLIIQNSCLMQIVRNEKIRLSDFNKYEQHHKNTKPVNYTPVYNKIQEQLKNLEFGNIVIVIKSGRVVQVEKTEKHRFQEFTGMDGEGI